MSKKSEPAKTIKKEKIKKQPQVSNTIEVLMDKVATTVTSEIVKSTMQLNQQYMMIVHDMGKKHSIEINGIKEEYQDHINRLEEATKIKDQMLEEKDEQLLQLQGDVDRLVTEANSKSLNAQPIIGFNQQQIGEAISNFDNNIGNRVNAGMQKAFQDFKMGK